MQSRLIAATSILVLAGCSNPVERPPATAVQAPDTAAVALSSRPAVVFLGTSLTAGLGVEPAQAYPALIQRKADSAGLALAIENRGVSGETSAGALARLSWILRTAPAMIVIETGANDGLRGQDPETTKANLRAIIAQIRARDSTTRIALVQMEAMPNLGRRYTERFHAIYPEVAREDRVTLVPFLLVGVAAVDSLNQADGIHPTPRGHQIVAQTVWKALRPTFEALSRDGAR